MIDEGSRFAIASRVAVLALVLASPPGTARAGPVGLKHETSVYIDDRDGPLKSPEGVACDDRGRLVVADTGNGRLLGYEWRDGALRGGAEIKLPQVPYPVRVQIDGRGNVLVLDRRTRRIARVDAAGAFAGHVEPKGTPSAAAIVPASFRVDAFDNVYVLDAAARRVVVLDPAGKVVREAALPDGAAQFTDVAVDGAGRVLAVDAVGAAVWALDKGAASFRPLTGSLKDRMSFPTYAAIARGRILLVDQNGNGVVVLGQDGTYLGRELAIGWADGAVYYPAQMCIGSQGTAFVADRGNNRVQIFTMPR
jgi:DNA-binding beta-propeller fold protein YncE